MAHLVAGPSEFQTLHSPQQERRLEGHTPALKCFDSRMTNVICTQPVIQTLLTTGRLEKLGSPRIFDEP